MCWRARFGGSALPRPWSKYTEGSSRFRALHAAEQPVQAPGVRELRKASKAARAQGATPEEEGGAEQGFYTRLQSMWACMVLCCMQCSS